MSNELRLSVSKCKTFSSCKRKYKYTYIDKLPHKTWTFHSIGKFCHKVLEDFHNHYINGLNEPYNIVMSKAFKTAMSIYKKDINSDMKKECWNIINEYLKAISKKDNYFPNVLACEKNFELLVDNKFILNGCIDRLQLDADDVYHVLDYKTTKNKKYLKDDWFQLGAYAYIIASEDSDIKKIRASYVLLRHNFEHITTEFSINEILKIKDQFSEYVDLISVEKDFNPNPTRLCDWCDYVDICSKERNIVNFSSTYGEVEW
jgi:putative RecB family exonuclease